MEKRSFPGPILIIILTLILSVMPMQQAQAAPGGSYADVGTGSPYYPYIKYLSDENIMAGYPDGSFRPSYPLTRAEFISLAMKAKKHPLPAIAAGRRFSDLAASNWAYAHIDAAVKAGLTGGYPDGSFRPNATITRAEAAVLLSKLFGKELPAVKLPAEIKDIQTDWAKNAIALGLDSGMLEKTGENSFSPDSALTREQAARAFAYFITLDSPDKEELAGTLNDIEGSVYVFRKGDNIEANNGMSCLPGDSISTGKNSGATLNYPDGSSFKINEDTKLKITSATGIPTILKDGSRALQVDYIKVYLEKGRIFGALASQHEETEAIGNIDGSYIAGTDDNWKNGLYAATNGDDWYKQQYATQVKVEVDMAWGVAGVRGSFWSNESTDTEGTTSLLSGNVFMGSSLTGAAVQLQPGQFTRSRSHGGHPDKPSDMPPGERQQWDDASGWVQNTSTTIRSMAPTITPPGNPPPTGGDDTGDDGTGGDDTGDTGDDTGDDGGDDTGGTGGGGGSPDVKFDSITVTPGTILGVGQSAQINAVVRPVTATVTYESKNPSIASVSASGTVTGLAPGNAVIQVKGQKSGYTSKMQNVVITVVGEEKRITIESISITPEGNLDIGDTAQLNVVTSPAAATLTYQSDNSLAAAVNGSGQITAIGGGTATITVTATLAGYASAQQTIGVTVNGPNLTINSASISPSEINVGESAQISVDVTPPDASLTYISDDPAVAAVNASGQVSGIAKGGAVIHITASKEGYTSAETSVSITVNSTDPFIEIQGVSVSPSTTMEVGGSAQISVTTVPPDAVLRYESSAPSIANVNSNGTVHGVKEGSAVITITASKNGYQDATSTVTITVTEAQKYVEFTEFSISETHLETGGYACLTLKTFPPGAEISVISSNPEVLSIYHYPTLPPSGGDGKDGPFSGDSWYLYGLLPGVSQVTVTASFPGWVSASHSEVVTVTAPELTSYTITGYVEDDDHCPQSGADVYVKLAGTPIASGTTEADGSYSITTPPLSSSTTLMIYAIYIGCYHGWTGVITGGNSEINASLITLEIMP